jgi:hypothetical protein
MAKRRRRPRAAAKKTPPPPKKEEPQTGPTFSVDAINCIALTAYNLREAVEATAIKRAKGTDPVPLAAIRTAFMEHDLGWALPSDKEMTEVAENDGEETDETTDGTEGAEEDEESTEKEDQ